MRSDKGGVAGETKDAAVSLLNLLKAYVLQETVGPFKRLGRTIAYGVAGSLLLGLGVAILLLGVLRVLQTETGRAFAGNWSFAPFLLSAAAALLAAGIAGLIGWKGIQRSGRKQGGRA
jgi:hypothetical protein